MAISTNSDVKVPDSRSLGIDDAYGPFINGAFQPVRGDTLDAVAPATGDLLSKISRGDAQDIDEAVAAASAAFPAWRALSYEERSALLIRFADALTENAERLAAIDALDTGRRLFETRLDYQLAASQYRYFAGAVLTHEGMGRPMPGGYMIAKREPLGVCGQIIPWNVPAIMTSFKLAPALAAGNTVVLKPDENASISTMEAAKLAAEIFPAGVINVVPGRGAEAGAALTAHPDVDKLAFTGSTEVGRLVGTAAAKRLIPATLELGGKSPNIVFPDIDDVDAVADNVLYGAMWHNGQVCFGGTRVFVHDDIYDRFMPRLIERAESLTVGGPFDDTARLTCLVSEKQATRVLGYIDIGKNEGAKLLTGGERVTVEGNEQGYFIQPTIFEATNDMRIAQEEIFGPVICVIRWNDVETLVQEANDTQFGLAAGIYTRDLKNAMDTADRLQAGSVWINSYANLVPGLPFGGYKDSGLGREFSHEALNMYSQLKAVAVQYEVGAPWFSQTYNG
ncbi:aldehyde dehydrogenase [Streptomyces sp. KS_5]|uniref:aldehyde dehydrogenase family protein n=1 Tax=Streptomyces sp. KS_5 TaxID=1881018 RepID=UPI0008987427|nr:aldehyde dehydrogenase family protein [Streptomyces sp. KS_5]SEE36054.1 Acyl-CoA reductase [Streptomyces sp. KS_5]